MISTNIWIPLWHMVDARHALINDTQTMTSRHW